MALRSSDTIQNPHFPASHDILEAEHRRMVADPIRPVRPVVILGGYRSPWITSRACFGRLVPLVGGQKDDFLAVAYPFASSIRGAARGLYKSLQRRGWLDREVDVVGVSMGGLVARALAAGLVDGLPPLPIKRLFTLSTPHRGAAITRLVAPDDATIDMIPGSPFLTKLDECFAARSFEIVCYTYLRDWWVGTANTAPPEHTPIWLDPPDMFGKLISHFTMSNSRGLHTDIARRLRGEEPLARAGANALPF